MGKQLKYYIVGYNSSGVAAPIKDENGVMGWIDRDKADTAAEILNKDYHKTGFKYTVKELIRH